MKENEQDYKKLLKYEMSLLDYFKWEQKDRYFLLIINFWDKKSQYRSIYIICQLFKFKYEPQNLVEELKLDFEKLEKIDKKGLAGG